MEIPEELITKKTKCPWCLKQHYVELEKDWEEAVITCPHCDKLSRMGNWSIDRTDFKTSTKASGNK